MMFPLSLVGGATLLLFPLLTAAECECGYMLKQTRAFFTHKMHTDFSQMPDTQDVNSTLTDWEVQTWKSDADPKTGVLARQNEASNVWVEDGMLHLRMKGFDKKTDKAVSVAEIHSRRKDFYRGSYRARYRINRDKKADGGAVVGFFSYYDDKDEIDIEILTKDAAQKNGDKIIRYTQQPAYDNVTDSAIPDATFQVQLKKPWSEMQEHRFDWAPSLTTFFQDNSAKKEMTKNVPTHESGLLLNLWANNGTWSGPPSTKDIEMEVEFILAYFNTSASQTGSDTGFNTACAAAGGPKNKTVCWVNDKSGVNSEDSKVTLSSASTFSRNLLLAGLGAILAGAVLVM